MAELLEDVDGAPYPEGVQAIAAERVRQITVLGYDEQHDERHPVSDFVVPAIQLLGGDSCIRSSFTLKRADAGSGCYQRDDLIRAGALIAAAIDLLDNATTKEH